MIVSSTEVCLDVLYKKMNHNAILFEFIERMPFFPKFVVSNNFPTASTFHSKHYRTTYVHVQRHKRFIFQIANSRKIFVKGDILIDDDTGWHRINFVI